MSRKADPSAASALGAADRIRQLLPGLSHSLRKVGETVLADPAGIEHLSAAELAQRAGTSQATVTRFGQACGFESYQDLLLTLARDRGRASSLADAWVTEQVGPEIHPDDPLDRVVSVIAAADIRGLQAAASAIDLSALEEAASAIGGARRVDLYGVGGSGVIAVETEMRLLRIGSSVRAWRDVHEAVTSASLLTPADVAVAISHSGETRDVFEPLEVARARGATTVAITHAPRSSVAALADITLTVTDSPTSYRDGGFASRHAFLLVIDCLYARVAQVTFHRASTSMELTSEVRERLSVRGRGRDHRGTRRGP